MTCALYALAIFIGIPLALHVWQEHRPRTWRCPHGLGVLDQCARCESERRGRL